jgi:hypothetical protein
MNKEFIPYEQALELKKLGFEEICFAWYHKGKLTFNELYNLPDINDHPRNSSAPLYQQAFRWFREKQEYYTDLFIDDDKKFGYMISNFIIYDRVDSPISRKYLTYEEAELACLKKLIEIVKTNNL